MKRRVLQAWLAALIAALHAVAAPCAELPEPKYPIAPILGDPPVAPHPTRIPAPELAVAAFPAQGLVIDTQDREAVRIFYRGLFFQSDNVSMGWTGDYATGNAGTTNQLFQDAVALRINWHRALAGVPANVSLYGPYNVKNQQAALMMSANGQLSHFPPTSWTYYTADGYEAAGKSNLSLGRTGATAVTYGYVQDPGSNNALVGHRRWVLYPQTRNMGTGDVPGGLLNSSPVSQANALWVLDSYYGTSRPATRDDFVAWPPKGYIPYPVVFGRWSLSYPDADFTNATVTVSKGGTAIPVSIEFQSNSSSSNIGEDTIVWLLSGVTNGSVWPRPSADETYAVTVANVMVPGATRTFSYNVVVFDPDVVTPGAPVATVTAPATAIAAVPFTATVASMANATGYQIDLHRSSALGGALTPANSAASWTQTVNGYNALGSTEFQLRHAEFETQQLALNKSLYVGQSASLSFDSRFGYATADEVAKVQISLDGGVSWQDVLVQPGAGNPTASAPSTIDLAPFAARMIQVRFLYAATGGYYSCESCGWFFNNIALNNVSELSLATWATMPPTQLSANLTPPDPGNYLLLARAEYQGTYFGDWGPGSAIQVATGDIVAPSMPTGFTVTAVSTTQINLSWTAATDNVAVTQYKIYRGGTLLTTLTGAPPATSYNNTGLTASTSYSYSVQACDAAGNCSAQSTAVSATTQAVPDTQAPSVPTGLTATAIGSSQINLAWTASSDNVGVTQYRVYRAGAEVATVNSPATGYGDTGLTASTSYSYTVAACDAAGNCSAQSSPASATTQAAGSLSFTAALEPGFNLIGNCLNFTIGVPVAFGNADAPVSGVTPNVITIWKWNAADGRWAFYSPQLSVAGIAAFAASKGYDVLSTINPGEGYWVNSITQMTLPAQTGSGLNWNSISFGALLSGFNLIAHANTVTPSQFNALVSAIPPAPGAVPTDNFLSLWAWDALAANWYFYSPLLESSGGLATVKSYADSRNYLHFQDTGKTLGICAGFWVNRP